MCTCNGLKEKLSTCSRLFDLWYENGPNLIRAITTKLFCPKEIFPFPPLGLSLVKFLQNAWSVGPHALLFVVIVVSCSAYKITVGGLHGRHVIQVQ